MFCDAWGNQYSTYQEAEQNVTENYLSDDDLISELSYEFDGVDLLYWIFQDIRRREAFEGEFFNEIDNARKAWVDNYITETYEES